MRPSSVLFVFVAGCSIPNFDPPSLVRSVRILATRADRPYAQPGDTVNMTVLAVDGRQSAPSPMNVYWLPAPCFDPPGDNYYACFPAFAGAFPTGVAIDANLELGTTFSFQMPLDVIATGQSTYGLAVVFTIACAGHVRYVPPPTGASPDTVPFGCFDNAGKPLSADDFVFAFSRIYSFTHRTNSNPVLQSVTLRSAPVDPTAGMTLDRCTTSNLDDCPTAGLDVVVPSASQEPDPSNLDANGHVLNEEIYVDYYLTAGKVKNDAVVLFDPRSGRLSGTSDDLAAPQSAGDSRLWAVVHDNRGGVAWQEIAVHAR